MEIEFQKDWKPTANLRWNSEVLEQEFIRESYSRSSQGVVITSLEHRWQPVGSK